MLWSLTSRGTVCPRCPGDLGVMAGEAGGVSLRGAGLPGVRVPCLSLWSCAGGCAKGKSSVGQGGLSSCLGRVRMAARQGSAFSWPSPGTGGLKHPLVALSKAGRAFLPEAPSQRREGSRGAGGRGGQAAHGGDRRLGSDPRPARALGGGDPRHRPGAGISSLCGGKGVTGVMGEKSGALGAGGVRAVSARTLGSVFPVSSPPWG